MKKVFFMVLAAALPLMYTACSDDDDDNGGQYRVDNETAYNDSIHSSGYVMIDTLVFQGAPAGVYYKDLTSPEVVKGTEHPLQTSKVKVLYKGYFYDGTVFSPGSYGTGGNPVEFAVSNQTIVPSGLSIALQQMVKGNHWRICIPWHLGYGNTNYSTIPAYSTLVYDVTLLEIKQYPN